MKRLAYPLSLIIILFIVFGLAVHIVRAARKAEPPKPDVKATLSDPGETAPIKQAILDALNRNQIMAPAYQIYRQSVEDVKESSDQTWARAWLVGLDPQTGDPAPCEPGLVLAEWNGNDWQVTLPTDAGWAQAVKEAPLNLLPQEAKTDQLQLMTLAKVQMPTSAFTGYRLPWQAGVTKHLSQSTYHDYYTPSGTAHYAFDFYVHEQIWDILAVKPGIVWKYYDAVPTCYDLNCGQDLGNYLVVKDPTTNPVSYMLYLHLAQGSIPAELKHQGALVKQAQFIGKADNTGASWGDHLHFMVHTNPDSYWGQSVDIRFSDVTINGGRPRVEADKAFCDWPGDVCTSTSTDYISFNTPVQDNTIPGAGISSPGNGDVVSARAITINGWGSDNQAGIFSLQLFLNSTGAWQPLNTVYFTNSISYTWDWCNAHLSDGTISLGIQATDLAGHISAITGVRTVTKSFTCPVTSAGVDLPLSGSTVNTRQVTLSGWGVGETGLAGLQALANYNGTWQNVGTTSSSSPLTFQWDLCNAGVPDGPVSIAFQATDLAGPKSPISDVHNFIKDYACPAPTPDANKVLICSEPGYGNCYSYGIGQYASGDTNHPMDPLPDASAYSIRIGSNVQATLFDTKTWSQRGTTYFEDDPNMEDNILRQETMSSFKVQARNTLPTAPSLPAPNASYQAEDVVIMNWENTGGALEYQVMVTGTINTNTSWQSLPYLHWENLGPGQYNWKVRGRNPNGVSDWSALGTFDIATVKSSGSGVQSAPYSDNMETSPSSWSSSGLWHLGDAATATTPSHSGSHAWWFQNAQGDYGTSDSANSGNLTSPPIYLPGAGYSLRFWYYYDTETGYPYYDQRWVQISEDGAPFTNVLQLTFDVQAKWLQSPFIDLSRYTGHTIRVRFQFETLDKKYNADRGWGIDDFSVDTTAPPSCGDTNEANNTQGTATPISYGDDVSGQICPPGDVDFYAFNGSAGDVIGADIQAQSINSKLDSVLYLLDQKGDLLSWNDDRVAYVQVDSLLYYKLPANGMYYLKVIAWNHPGSGDSDYYYHLRLYKDVQKPQLTLDVPLNNGVIPGSIFRITASASDSSSGVSHVDFKWHTGDWVNGSWTTIGSDWDGSDGWSAEFDASSMLGQQELAFFVQAFDRAGNAMSAAAWNVSVINDFTPPVLSVAALPATETSTAIQLQWTASDAQSGIDHFEVQSRMDGGVWQNADLNVPSLARSLWYVGQPGHSYGFRMQARDRAGNLRAYPTGDEAATTIPTNICAALDVYEPDETAAAPIQTNGVAQTHNLCNPAPGSGGLGDQDWVTFTAESGQRYLIQALPQNPAAALNLTLYANDKATVLAQASTSGYGIPTSLIWKAQGAGPVYVKMQHINLGVAGSSVSYQVIVVKNYPMLFFPRIDH